MKINMERYLNEPITEKQQNLIDAMEDILDIQFEGKTKMEATDFIKNNMYEFRKKIEQINYLKMSLNDDELDWFTGECYLMY